MRSVPAPRRVSAIVALAAVVAVMAVTVVALARHLLELVVAIVCLWLVIAAAAYAVTRTGARRQVAVVAAVLALAVPLVLVVANGQVLPLLLLIALVAVAGVATRYALGRDIKSLKSGPTPGAAVGPATRPVLLMNPKSGGGKVERFGLVEQARRRGIEPVVLAPGDDLLQLAEQAVTSGADVVGMAGGDGSQALVAGVAMRQGVGFVCVPAGTRNHLAMDLGLDRDDAVGALEAFGAAVERRIDLGLAGDRVFVNNATVGLYAKIVQSPAYRDRKAGTALELLPGMLGPDAVPFDLRRASGPGGASTPVRWASSPPGSGPPVTRRGSRGGRPPGRPAARAAGWNGPIPASRSTPASRWRWAWTARRWCWTHRSGSGACRGRCGCGSRRTRPATRPPPPCQPGLGHHHRAAADGRRPPGRHRAVSRSAPEASRYSTGMAATPLTRKCSST
jgi:Diacylglycerol kinase catalytic domain